MTRIPRPVIKCEHNKTKQMCRTCSPNRFCMHNRQKPSCKDCGGKSICIHGKNKSICKECGGKAICEHNNNRAQCKTCSPHSFCIHTRYKYDCSICKPETPRQYTIPPDRQYASRNCVHDKLKYLCKECGGAGICEHGRIKSTCKPCGGWRICIHNKQKYSCMDCKPLHATINLCRMRVCNALKLFNITKQYSTMRYLGCDVITLRHHLESQFTSDMTWDNHGTYWQIDHIIPLMYDSDNVTEEIIIQRMHYTNLQPLERKLNSSKGNRYIG